MLQELKKIIGCFLIVALAIVYALVAIAIASARLADASGWMHLLFFSLTGLLWIVPAMFIISWMMKPAPRKN